MCILTLLLWTGAAVAKAPAAAWEPPAAFAEDYNRAVEALNAGNPAKAEEITTRLAAKAPDCGMVLVLLGQSRTRQNDPTDALAPLRRAVELFPERAIAQVLLAEAAFGAQDFPLAAEASGRALTLDPADLGNASFSVQTSLRLGDVAEARARLARSQVGDADRACIEVGILLEAKDIPAAKGRFAACNEAADARLRTNARSALAGHTDDDMTVLEAAADMGISGYALAERGGKLLEAGRCGEAIPVLEAARVALPKDIGVRVNLAHCLVSEGRLEEAERGLIEVVAGETWIDVHVTGAMSGITSKSAEERLHEIQRDAAMLLVDVQTRRSRTKEATQSLAQARARYGEVVDIVIAEAALTTAQGHAPEGWSLLRSAMTRFPKEPRLAAALSDRALADPSGLDPAVVAYVRTYGGLVDRANLGAAEGKAEDWAGCTDDYAAVAAADPTRTVAAENAYICAVNTGDVDRAFALLGPLGSAAPRGSVHDHALALQRADRHADTLGLLKLYPTEDPTLEPAMRTMAIASHLALGQHADAAALATKPGLDPRFLAWVGQELLLADRKNDAARILGDACPKLTGEDATTCAELVKRAGK